MCIYNVVLDSLEFFAYHGCREDEKMNGNTFLVDLSYSYASDAGMTDDLGDAVNYGEVYRIVAREMNKPANLLENVAYRIVESLKKDFPGMTEIGVTVSKKNPPVDGPCAWSRVNMNWKKDE